MDGFDIPDRITGSGIRDRAAVLVRSETYEEYELKCSLLGICPRHRFLDPLWWHTKLKRCQPALVFAYMFLILQLNTCLRWAGASVAVFLTALIAETLLAGGFTCAWAWVDSTVEFEKTSLEIERRRSRRS